jgi:type II secretion system protein N
LAADIFRIFTVDYFRLMKVLGSRAGIGVIFSCSFLFFLVVTFPYDMLKESIASGLSRASGLNITMGEFGAALPVGFRSTDLSITTSGAKAKTLKFKSAVVRINPLYLFAGKVAGKVLLSTGDNSQMEVFAAIPVGGILKGNPIPSKIGLEANKFKLDDLAALALSSLGSGPDANPLLAPVLGALGFSGKLDGDLQFSIDSGSPQQSTGTVNLKFIDATLKLSDPTLGLPDQRFIRAGISAAMSGGILNIEKGSGLESEEMTVSAAGSIGVRNPLTASQLQLEILVKLQKSLGEKFGFLMDAFSGGAARNGELRLQVKGPLSQPSTQPI